MQQNPPLAVGKKLEGGWRSSWAGVSIPLVLPMTVIIACAEIDTPGIVSLAQKPRCVVTQAKLLSPPLVFLLVETQSITLPIIPSAFLRMSTPGLHKASISVLCQRGEQTTSLN